MNLLVVINDPIFELTRRYSIREIEEFYNPKLIFDQVHLLSLFDTQDYRSEDLGSLVIHPLGFPYLKGDLLHQSGQLVEYIYRGVRTGVKILQENDISIIRNKNVHEFGLIGTLISRMTGRPFIQSLHSDYDTLLKLTKGRFVYYYKHLLETYNIRSAVKVIGISKYLVTYAKLHGAKSVTYIPNPVDIQPFLQYKDEEALSMLKEELGVSGKIVLLNVSRYGSPEKNVQRLLMAFSRIPKDLLGKSVLLVVGNGCGREGEFSRLAEDLRIAKNVRFLGIVPFKKILSFFKLADILVNPTICEGFNFALIEAMASGLPILTSNHPVPMENVDKSNGVVINPYDIDEMRDGLEHLMRLDRSERMKLGNSSKNKALRFDRDKTLGMEAELYLTLLR